MGLNLESIRFQNFLKLDFLSAMNAAQLTNYLMTELQDIERLQKEISSIKTEIGRQVSQMGTSITKPAFEDSTFSYGTEELKSKILAARAQKVKLAAELRGLRNLQKETKRVSKEMKSNKGADAHDAYARVMEALGNQAADLRLTWDSDDVLLIDDYVVEQGITYEEAYELVKNRGVEEQSSDIPEGL